MENQIKNLKISNFKSIREAELECGRINLFVGKPNVGKSNLLEALSLLGLTYSNAGKFLAEFIRYKKLSHLYSYYNLRTPIEISSNIGVAQIQHILEKNHFVYQHRATQQASENGKTPWQSTARLNPDGSFVEKNVQSGNPVKKYSFKHGTPISNEGKTFLSPPFGDNLFWVLETTPEMKDEIPALLEEYKLEFLVDLQDNELHIQRKKQNGYIYTIPYELIADTFQRIIFHYAAIFSNKNSILLFEEPESHSYPPYISDLARKIIDSKENQFFITTHSPDLFGTLVSNTPPEEIAIFIATFKDYETHFKKLTPDEISEMLNYGIDIFYNLKWFVHD